MADNSDQDEFLREGFSTLRDDFIKKSRILLADTGMPLDEAAQYVKATESAINFAAQNPSTESLMMATSVVNMMNKMLLLELRTEAAQNYELAKEASKKLATAELLAIRYKDQSERHQAESEKHKQLAETDELTNIPSRRAFYAQLDYAIQAHGTPISDGDRATKSGKEHQYYALVALDLDRLKSINDLEGHPGGDAAIKATADILNQIARHDEESASLGGRGSVARLGGDEFTLILETFADSQEEAKQNFDTALPKVQERLEGQSLNFNNKTYPLVYGAGMHVIQPGDDQASVYAKADEALEENKKNLEEKEARYQRTFALLEANDNVENLTHLETREAIEAREVSQRTVVPADDFSAKSGPEEPQA